MIVATFIDSNGIKHEFETRAEFEAFIAKFNNPQEAALNNIDSYTTRLEQFSKQFYKDAANENIYLGIGSTSVDFQIQIKENTRDIVYCINNGFLKIAIRLIKNFDPAKMDATFITAARLLVWRNKIHAFLGIPLVNNYKD